MAETVDQQKVKRSRKAALMLSATPTAVAPECGAATPLGTGLDDFAHAEPEAAPPAGIIEAAASSAEESDVNPAAAHAAPIEQGSAEMATIVSPAEATEKAQAMFGDVQGRMKAMFEKSSRMGEELVEFAKGNVEAVVASARVAAKAGETLGQEAAEYGKKNLESVTAHVKSVAAAKSPTELFQLQSEYAKASFDSAVAEASKLSEAMMKFAGEIAQPLSNRYALAAEKIKTTTV